MAYKGKKILAVVPARSGSKGIVRKNLSKVGGISLIGHAGIVCAKLGCIDHSIISTDDHVMKMEAEKYSLECPFLRPHELSTDDSSSIDVWKHAFIFAEKYYGIKYDYTLLLEPTSPLREEEDIKKVLDLLISSDCNSVVTVSETPAHYTPHKSLLLKSKKGINFFHSNGTKYSQRQMIPKLFHRNGVCYGMSREVLMTTENAIIENQTLPLIIDRPIVNIDEDFDLKLANWIYSEK